MKASDSRKLVSLPLSRPQLFGAPYIMANQPLMAPNGSVEPDAMAHFPACAFVSCCMIFLKSSASFGLTPAPTSASQRVWLTWMMLPIDPSGLGRPRMAPPKMAPFQVVVFRLARLG